MTWTYTPDFTGSRDQVRYLVGDTDTTDQLTSDEEIAYAVTQKGGVYPAALFVAGRIIAKLARRVSSSVGPVSVSLSDQIRHYNEVVIPEIKQGMASGALPFAGGISVSDKQAQEVDTDRVPPFFTRRTGDMPGVATVPTFTPDWWGE